MKKVISLILALTVFCSMFTVGTKAISLNYNASVQTASNIPDLKSDFELTILKFFREKINVLLEALGSPQMATNVELIGGPIRSVNYSDNNLQLIVHVTPDGSQNKKCYWYSSNPEIATVTSSGNVVFNESGTTTVYCVCEDGGFYDYVKVIVNPTNEQQELLH